MKELKEELPGAIEEIVHLCEEAFERETQRRQLRRKAQAIVEEAKRHEAKAALNREAAQNMLEVAMDEEKAAEALMRKAKVLEQIADDRTSDGNDFLKEAIDGELSDLAILFYEQGWGWRGKRAIPSPPWAATWADLEADVSWWE